MPQGGGQSDWQRRQAEQRREADQRTREQAKLAKEQYLDAQLRTADDKTFELDRQVTVLDEILTNSLSRPPLAFQQFKVSPRIPKFDPGPLGISSPAPKWADYAPPGTRGRWPSARRVSTIRARDGGSPGTVQGGDAASSPG